MALKVIAPSLAADPTFRERFRYESRQAASLDHPSVVTIHEAGEDAGRLFASMRLVEGGDLRGLLAQAGPMNPDRAVDLVAQVAGALDAAHARGLVHRDVKPSNILVERSGGVERAYLNDFGLVKRLGSDPDLTGSAAWVGSVDYLAPEQVRGAAVDVRTDVYALGAVLYAALTSQVPFPRSDTAAKLYASVNEAVPSVRQIRPELPAALDAVIQRATAKDPAVRFESAGAMGAAADAAVTGVATNLDAASAPATPTASPLAPPVGPWRRQHPKRAALAIAAAVAILAGGTGIALSLSGSGQERPRPTASHRSANSAAGAAPGAPGGPASGGLNTTTATFNPPVGGGRDRLRIVVFDLRRHGSWLTLDFGIGCVAPFGTIGCASGDLNMPLAWNGSAAYTASNNTAGGVRLIDPGGKKLYQPVLDDQQRPYSTVLPGYYDPGPLHLASTTFAAPPAGTSTLDVAFANGGPLIANVPVSSGPPRLPGGPGVVPAVASPFTAPPPNPDPTAFNLDVLDLMATVGNTTGSDQEAPGRSTLTLSADVLFAFNQATLSPQAQAVLASVAARIKNGADGPVTITGYTDAVGTDEVNVPLSEARAQAVATALTPLVAGSPATLQTSGMGAQDPIAPNTNGDGSDNPAGRALNRRVTLAYSVKAPEAPAPPAATGQPGPPPGAAGPRTVDFKPL
ncbi:MAG: protein kinase domain-containing protein [Acidimicrobiales bacterium]